MPSVSAASAVIPAVPSRCSASDNRNSVLRPAPALMAQGHCGFATRQDHHWFGKGVVAVFDLTGDGGMHLRHLPRLAFDSIGQDRRI